MTDDDDLQPKMTNNDLNQTIPHIDLKPKMADDDLENPMILERLVFMEHKIKFSWL